MPVAAHVNVCPAKTAGQDVKKTPPVLSRVPWVKSKTSGLIQLPKHSICAMQKAQGSGEQKNMNMGPMGMTQEPLFLTDLCSSVEVAGWSKVDSPGYHRRRLMAVFRALSRAPDITMATKIQSIQAY